jgi:hypothetical protein
VLDEVPGGKQAVLITGAGSGGRPVSFELCERRRIKTGYGCAQGRRLAFRQRDDRLLPSEQRVAHDAHASAALCQGSVRALLARQGFGLPGLVGRLVRRPAILLRVEFEYRLTGTGWAEARIADGTSEAVITASYLSDALGDLIRAVRHLLEGAAETRCSWEEEPGEYRWIFLRAGNDVRLTILEFDDLWGWPAEDGGVAVPSPEPDERGDLQFSTTQPLAVLARAIAEGAQATLDEHGETGYLAEWIEAPFPTYDLAQIRQYLSDL